MRTSAIISTLAVGLFPSALAAKAYIPYAWNDTAPEIHGKPVNAVYQQFMVDQTVTAVCPSYDTDCPSKNTTIISGPTGDATFWMGILNSHGQQIYTDSAYLEYGSVTGSLGISADTSPFTVELDSLINQTVLKFNGCDFVSCPTSSSATLKYPSKVFALSWGSAAFAEADGTCYPFKMMLVDTNASAVDYYSSA